MYIAQKVPVVGQISIDMSIYITHSLWGSHLTVNPLYKYCITYGD